MQIRKEPIPVSFEQQVEEILITLLDFDKAVGIIV